MRFIVLFFVGLGSAFASQSREIIVFKPQSAPPAVQPRTCGKSLTDKQPTDDWANLDEDLRIPILNAENGTKRRIRRGDRVSLWMGQQVLAIGRVAGFLENPSNRSELLIGIFDSVFSSTIFAVRAKFVEEKRSFIVPEFSLEEAEKYESQIVLSVGCPTAQVPASASFPLHRFIGAAGTSRQLLEQGSSCGLSIPNSELSTNLREKRRVRMGDIVVARMRRGGDLEAGIAVNVSFDAQESTGHRIKLITLEDWEHFFTHGADAWEWELFGLGLERQKDTAFILPVDWTLLKAGKPLSEVLAEKGLLLKEEWKYLHHAPNP